MFNLEQYSNMFNIKYLCSNVVYYITIYHACVSGFRMPATVPKSTGMSGTVPHIGSHGDDASCCLHHLLWAHHCPGGVLINWVKIHILQRPAVNEQPDLSNLMM